MTKTDKPPRVACVSLPHLAVALAEQAEAGLVGRPMAVVTAGDAHGERVYDASYLAHLAGVAAGMPLAQARQACPELVIRAARPELYRATFQELLATLTTFTTVVEPADVEHSWLATADLVPRGGREVTLADELAAHVRAELGLWPRVGLAHGKLTSHIVTRYLEQRHVMVLPAGREVAFLGGLATRYLPLAPPRLRRLAELGIAKVHQYAALPGRGILPRFGYEGLRAWHLAHGEDDAQVRAWQAEPYLEAEHLFAKPIANLRSLRYHVEQLALRLAQPLASRFQLAGALAVTVTFETGQAVTRERTLSEPAGQPGVLLTHAEALLATIQWGAPVERLRLAVQGLCPTLGRQLELFRQTQAGREGVERTLRRVQARYGGAVVQQGRLLEVASPLAERRAYLAPW
jgi:nucleotidyltransferase/DNA polymerase involved in DNA repair